MADRRRLVRRDNVRHNGVGWRLSDDEKLAYARRSTVHIRPGRGSVLQTTAGTFALRSHFPCKATTTADDDAKHGWWTG